MSKVPNFYFEDYLPAKPAKVANLEFFVHGDFSDFSNNTPQALFSGEAGEER